MPIKHPILWEHGMEWVSDDEGWGSKAVLKIKDVERQKSTISHFVKIRLST